MSQTHCQHCNTYYGDLQRAGQKILFVCMGAECGREFCEICAIHEPVGRSLRCLRCPNCSGDLSNPVNLAERFSIYSSPSDLMMSENCIALLLVPWSVLPKRNESLIREMIPRLHEFDPRFFLLNEDDISVRTAISELFPAICSPQAATGDGAVIWLHNGQPVDSLRGGPYLAKLEILERSRIAWS